MLERLRDRAKIAFAQFQSGLGLQPTVDKSEFPDDVAIISGRASVAAGPSGAMSRSGSPQSRDPTLRRPESPQSMPVSIPGVTTSPNTSPVVSDARVYNAHGNVSMDIGDAMQDLGLECPIWSEPHQYLRDMNRTNDVSGIDEVGMGGIGGVGTNERWAMDTNGMEVFMSHGSGGMLPPPPPHLGMDHVYNDPHSRQLYTMVRISLTVSPGNLT